ncbi:DUF2931 family protein [Elizabethkingia meningoseptica]|nr:DUF2931 family protein [Elizabethkingia meningoseptica]EJK5330653.1 DUF2931 family protein [Elizabethkingia meningoseptica]MDE5468506.1 DUF2931 family protein [Elizabethkingia meningoseptica]MDE5480048.1 DUF2931 family protein [Elizabethkingia meningoseptica]MDE5503451.1 DUF2931 family protein [Elizabethkingia meningoseptica]MDE5512782.1 DUF2931 family protein [Elizabethkingia meningoseptica]
MISLSILLFSCQKIKYPWQPGISAPKYYPVAGNISFNNAGHGSNTSFANGWGSEYGSVVSGDKYKEIPKNVYIDYYSVVDGKDFKGEVHLDQQEILKLFRKYKINDDNFAHLVVGMAPGGWIRVWFTTIDEKIEVAKAQLKGCKNNDVGIGLKTKDFKTWGNTYTYWQHHGIPYEAWAENEKDYDIIFDFNRLNREEVGFSYVSSDGTYYQTGGKKVHQKLPVQFEQIAWLNKTGDSYNCKLPIPKGFKKYIEQKRLKEVRLQLEIEDDGEHAIMYILLNNTKEKIVRFRNKQPTKEESKNVDFAYATEIEYFIP